MDSFFISAEGVLGLRTNLPEFKWSFGITTPPATRDRFDACTVRLQVEVGGARIFPALESDASAAPLGKYHYFRAHPGENRLLYERTLLGGSLLQIEAKNLRSAEPVLRVNRPYYKYISHRFMNLHSIGYIATDVAALTLLRNGFAPVHCSAFRTNGSTVVVVAPPNTGKTLSTMKACIEHGADFLAEDLAITDGETLYAVPWTSTFRYYSDIDRSRRSRLLAWMTEKVPVVELLAAGRRDPVDRFVPANRILDRAPITHVVVLERGLRSVTVVDPETALAKVVNLNRYEFNYHKAPLNVAYEFFNPGLDIEAAYQAERTILRRMTERAECVVVRTEDALDYTRLIMEHLSGGGQSGIPRGSIRVASA